jgi:hypothetical protein
MVFVRLILCLVLSGGIALAASAQTPATPPAASAPSAAPSVDEDWLVPLTPGEAPAETASKAPAPARLSESASPVKSLFYTPEEITAIRLAANSYRKRGGSVADDDFLDNLTGEKAAAPQVYVYPQFFLESLVYHSPKDWVIWLNNEKITQDTPKANTEISVEAIDENKVVLKWHPSLVDKDRVMDVWKRTPNTEIIVDVMDNSVQFALHTNQTFSSYVMRVLEGKVLPVAIDLNREPLLDAGGEETPAESHPEQPKGLPGLIEAYKHLDENELKKEAEENKKP